MKIKYDCIDTNYNRHLRKARVYARGLAGYERATKIYKYFEGCGHPHPRLTFIDVRMNDTEGQTDRQFAINLMKEMAYLTAVNDMLRLKKSKNDK
ncbi:hypothetical protein [Psychrosphaera aestuarii]|uniref:hypothetical protein n=1 Tax=Psychrosphaera aestuarii TaxID=1266052 RepID=UPI001B33B1EB|nr:hypothetical protein [Psychrosphaera aestuarii]